MYFGKTVEVTIPEIEVMRLAHYVTIGAECSTSLGHYLEKQYVPRTPHEPLCNNLNIKMYLILIS